jgi:hypothetical protein
VELCLASADLAEAQKSFPSLVIPTGLQAGIVTVPINSHLGALYCEEFHHETDYRRCLLVEYGGSPGWPVETNWHRSFRRDEDAKKLTADRAWELFNKFKNCEKAVLSDG